MSGSDRKPKASPQERSESKRKAQSPDNKRQEDRGKAHKLWVSPKLRESLRPSVVRTQEVDADLFGDSPNRDRMRTHPYVQLADKVLSNRAEQSAPSGSVDEEPPARRRA